MAIEIREVVIRATVTKSSVPVGQDIATKQDLQKLQEKIMDKITRKVKDLIVEERSSR
jgi:hypothetical protein